MSKRIRKYHKFALPALGFGLGLIILGSSTPSVIGVVGNQKAITVGNEQWNVMDESVIGQKIGTVRHWNNTGFSGTTIKDGGYVALTGTNAVSRTDSFGNVLWTFDPSNQQIKGYQDSWKNKRAVEIVQDKAEGFSNVFYILLVPKETPDEAGNTADGAQEQQYSYASIKNDKSKQATVVQLVEDISGNSTSSVWRTGFAVVNSVEISPQTMVDNYPQQWKTASSKSNNGVSFFSLDQHASWYDDQSGASGFVMPWRQYITNLGNMYGFQGTLFIFGGNGTIFNDPEALSIGLFRVKFSLTTPEVVGLPYAYALSGISWFVDAQPSVNGETGVWHSLKKPIEYDSKLPLGQDVTFSYVPRMAVAGVQPNFLDDNGSSIPNYLYVAGTITTGQSKDSQAKTSPTNDNSGSSSGDIISIKHYDINGNSNDSQTNKNPNGWNATYNRTSTRSLQPSGENHIASQPLAGKATTENSIDPLTLFGTPFSLAALMSFEPKTSNDPYGYTNVMANGRYYDTPVFSGAQSGNYSTYGKKQPILQNGTTTNGVISQEDSKVKNIHQDLVDASSRFLFTNTLTFGQSTKSVSGLIQFNDKNGNQGYMYQVGVATVSFVAPLFDVSSLVYRNPAKSTLPFESIGEGYLGDKTGFASGTQNNGGYTNEYWFTTPSTNDGIQRNIGLDIMVRPWSAAIYDNWKVEDLTAQWNYSTLSQQVQKSSSVSARYVKTTDTANSEKIDPKLNFENFRGLSNSLDIEKQTSNIVQSAWEDTSLTREGKTTNMSIAYEPLLTVFEEDNKRVGAKNGNPHLHSSIVLAYKAYAPNKSWDKKIFSTLAYYPTDFTRPKFIDGVQTYTNFNNVGENVSTLFSPEPNNPQVSFVGQMEGKKELTSIEYNSDSKDLELSTRDGQKERFETLGSGTFTGSLSNDLLQKNISDLFDFNVNVPGVGTNQTVLNKKWLPQFFEIKQEPKWDKVDANSDIDKVKLVVTNMDLVTQTMTLTAYAYNQENQTYALMPSSAGNGQISLINVANYTGFKALAAWVLPVAIAVPIVVVSLVIGLGLGIGLPMQKNKQMLKLGFELQNKKVDTLTTAVGGVFKKIINQTKTDNLKKAPQMLKAASPKPATPSAAPKAPSAPAPTAKPTAPTAPKAPSAPSAS